jgi:putative flippase GtrA
MNLSQPKERTRLIKFAIVGAIGAAVDFGIFNLFASVLNVPALPAGMISFVAAVISNFTWNRLWTYPDSRSKRLSHQITQFFLVSTAGLIIRALLFLVFENALVDLCTRILSSSSISPTIVGHNLMLALAILIVMAWNFVANRYWTYNDVE